MGLLGRHNACQLAHPGLRKRKDTARSVHMAATHVVWMECACNVSKVPFSSKGPVIGYAHMEPILQIVYVLTALITVHNVPRIAAFLVILAIIQMELLVIHAPRDAPCARPKVNAKPVRHLIT